MTSMREIGIILIVLIFVFFLIRFFKELLSKFKKKFKKKKIGAKGVFLSSKIKFKADRKYEKLLSEFKRKHKRRPLRDDLFRIVIAASHHTFPVKGRNVRRWTKGRLGHWNRQKVRKYLLEKHAKNYKMK
jgi:hypothetical protein